MKCKTVLDTAFEKARKLTFEFITEQLQETSQELGVLKKQCKHALQTMFYTYFAGLMRNRTFAEPRRLRQAGHEC